MIEYTTPEGIEARSLAIIGEELKELRGQRGADNARSALEEAIVRRVIHTTADFDFDGNLVFTRGAAETARGLLRGGCTVITDTNMALAGISKRVLAGFGGKALCFIADEDVARDARERGVTRAEASVDKAARTVQPPFIYAAGNAPTALLRIAALHEAGTFCPGLLIAVPVGFVNVVEAKELCLGLDIPCIAARGRKGGSAVAAAIVNAILYAR
jgi:precorrin-8X/cobalt-precorrin-8 methylmutase